MALSVLRQSRETTVILGGGGLLEEGLSPGPGSRTQLGGQWRKKQRRLLIPCLLRVGKRKAVIAQPARAPWEGREANQEQRPL